MQRVMKKLRAGDWVEVKSAGEISATLDSRGTLDDLPFMPEMVEFCGRRVQVARLVEKICVEFPGGTYQMREFKDNDAVVLDLPRCSGEKHEGCGRACVLFWKSAWLRRVRSDEAPPRRNPGEEQKLLASLKTTTGDGRYFCQSTQMADATQSITRAQVIVKCFRDVLSGSVGIGEMIRNVVVPVWRYITERFQKPLEVGHLKKTPVGDLDLQPGEIVKIRSEEEIVHTLDRFARNRGLRCDRGMRQFCGGTFQVRNRLDRLISESTGEMRKVDSTVILEGLQCICNWNHVGGCPRGDYMYWREIWLERVGTGQADAEGKGERRTPVTAPGSGKTH